MAKIAEVVIEAAKADVPRLSEKFNHASDRRDAARKRFKEAEQAYLSAKSDLDTLQQSVSDAADRYRAMLDFIRENGGAAGAEWVRLTEHRV